MPFNPKYLHLIVLSLPIIFAAIELGLTVQERTKLDFSNVPSTSHRLDYLIACSGWTIGWSLLLILLSLAVGAESLGLKVFFAIYFIITAVAWIVGGTLWHFEVKDHGCDLGHGECHHNDRIQGIAWAEALKHVIGTLTFGYKVFRGNKGAPASAGFNGQKYQMEGGYDDQKGQPGTPYA